ncbi:hypothetical protein D3C72_1719120 [compost metagenome]
MRSISQASKIASRMARPAGNIPRRSGLMPSMSSLSTSPSLKILRLSQARPSGLISPVPSPAAWIARPMALMVPDAPTASCQPSRRRACSMPMISRRAAV